MNSPNRLCPFAALLCACLLAACGGGLDETAAVDDLSSAKKHSCRSTRDCAHGLVCVHRICQSPPANGGCSTSDDCPDGGLCDSGACTPSACNHRSSGKTGLRADVTITRYQGLTRGHNGTHEIAYGTISKLLWVHDSGTIDTRSVQLALNVSSRSDPAGLPHEIPFRAGQVVEVEGEYISGASAGLGGTAVVHFAHSTCGFVDVGGREYR